MIISSFTKPLSFKKTITIQTTQKCVLLSLSLVSTQGMMVLHNSPVQVHGRLKSSNCLIDSRWVCKIGDWGLSELRSPLDRCQLQEGSEKYNGMSRNVFNPLTPKISLAILLTVCHTVLVMLVWRIWYWIN